MGGLTGRVLDQRVVAVVDLQRGVPNIEPGKRTLQPVAGSVLELPLLIGLRGTAVRDRAKNMQIGATGAGVLEVRQRRNRPGGRIWGRRHFPTRLVGETHSIFKTGRPW
jgi:hypothetical protein